MSSKLKSMEGTTRVQKNKLPKRLPKPSTEKVWLHYTLLCWASMRKIKMEPEHRFHPERKWRFDWAFPALKIAVEYEGLFSAKSRHTTVNGFIADVEKYNQATVLGWRVIRVTARDYKTITSFLNQLYEPV